MSGRLIFKSLRVRPSFQSFSTKTLSYEAKPVETKVVESSDAALRVSHPPSSVPHGQPLKGINYLKTQSDPLAKPDEEYPEWLWTLLDPKVPPTDIFSREYQRKINKDAIKSRNFLKKK